MVLVLAMAAALWGIGAWMRVPVSARLIMVGLLYVAVLMVQIALPVGHPLREATGGSPALWLMIGGAVAIVLAYREGLERLRRRARAAEDALAAGKEPARTGPFSDAELNRYARHIVLREVGGAGQKALKEARVLVIGAGGLGSPALQYLAAAGVGTIGMIDDDVVDSANLHRQVIHKDARIGMPKVFSAETELTAQNPFVKIRPYNRRLTEEIAADLLAEYDILLDGSDNFDTRYLSNRVAVSAGKPLVSGALTQWEGQVSVFDPSAGTPCYECVFPERPAPGLAPPCAEAGVIGPLPGVIGSIMALEAIKIITGAGQPLLGEMLIYDGLWGETRKMRIARRPDCPVCGKIPDA